MEKKLTTEINGIAKATEVIKASTVTGGGIAADAAPVGLVVSATRHVQVPTPISNGKKTVKSLLQASASARQDPEVFGEDVVMNRVTDFLRDSARTLRTQDLSTLAATMLTNTGGSKKRDTADALSNVKVMIETLITKLKEEA